MKQQIKNSHPYNEDNQPYTCKDVCFNVDVGDHFLFKSTKNCDIDKFGVGIVLYFRYIKMLIAFFFIFSILVIPSILFNVNGKFQNLSN